MKTIIAILVFITSLTANAQNGIVTVKDDKADVPLSQWYVIADKEYNNHAFFYAEKSICYEELRSILKQDDQDIEIPKGQDSDGDDYWIILHENEFISHIYLSRYKNSEDSMITIVTN